MARVPARGEDATGYTARIPCELRKSVLFEQKCPRKVFGLCDALSGNFLRPYALTSLRFLRRPAAQLFAHPLALFGRELPPLFAQFPATFRWQVAKPAEVFPQPRLLFR